MCLPLVFGVLLSDSLVFAIAVIVEAANAARAELVRAALEAAKQKGLDSESLRAESLRVNTTHLTCVFET